LLVTSKFIKAPSKVNNELSVNRAMGSQILWERLHSRQQIAIQAIRWCQGGHFSFPAIIALLPKRRPNGAFLSRLKPLLHQILQQGFERFCQNPGGIGITGMVGAESEAGTVSK